MIIWTLDVVNKQAIASASVVDFMALAASLNIPVFYKSAQHPFFISQGWLFTCEVPQ